MRRHAPSGGGDAGGRLKGAIKKFFLIDERGTSIGTEIRAGVVTFLTMSYILLVNPQILSKMGLPASDVVVATAISSGLASLVCGIFGNLPFGLAPGTGLSAYLSYGLVMSGVLTRSQAMTACLISGATMGLSALVGLSTVIMVVIPRSVKLATVVGMGLLIALIGMVSIKLVVPNKDTLVALGEFNDYHIWLSLVGLVLTGSFLFHQVKGGVLVAIILITVTVWVVDGSGPTKIAELPYLHRGIWKNIEFSSYSYDMVPAILAFLFVGIFDLSGVIHGLSSLAKINDETGHCPGSLWAFLSSSVGTIVAAMAGCSPIIIHVESASGIREGGRTGLTAVTVGFLFFLSVFLAPLFTKVPNAATAPILILVGAMMISESQHIDWQDMSQAIPAFLTIMMMPFTFSIPNGILFGIGMSSAFFITTGEFLNYLPHKRNWFGGGGGGGGDGITAAGSSKDTFPLAVTVNGNAPPDETSHLNEEEFPPRTPSFFDETPLRRRLSLILPKDEADALDQQEIASPKPGSWSNRHPHSNGHGTFGSPSVAIVTSL